MRTCIALISFPRRACQIRDAPKEQRVLRAGAHFSSSSQTIAPGKLVYYAHCEVEPLRTLRLTDDCCSVPIGFTYLGAFLPPPPLC